MRDIEDLGSAILVKLSFTKQKRSIIRQIKTVFKQQKYIKYVLRMSKRPIFFICCRLLYKTEKDHYIRHNLFLITSQTVFKQGK
jgi:hypothetical protein